MSQQQQQQHHPISPSNYTSSPPLPNLHTLNISDNIDANLGGGNNQGEYRYQGVFGPPGIQTQTQNQPQGQGWGQDKRGSRSGIPTNWYDPPALSPASFDAYRQPSPALSPPTSTSSGPSTSSHPYLSHQPPPYPESYHHNTMSAIGLANTPSPPPMAFGNPPFGNPGFGSGMFGLGGMSVTNSAPNLHSIHSGMPQFGSQSLANISRAGWRGSGIYTPTSNGGSIGGGGGGVGGGMDEDVIPTAIVIKNIPFSVPRESLLSIIESLGAPLPYAFNYHHDSGVFRGLAFANFRQPDEAAAVVAALNGYDVSGRKLRVEYKKVLQPGEKDRIEREKALKRMRSVQGLDKSFGVNGDMPPPPLPSLRSTTNGFPSSLSSSASTGLNGYTSINGNSHPYLSPTDNDPSPPPSAISTSTSSGTDNLPLTLDMNDPSALDIYSRCLLFKEDRMRDELSFSKNLTPHERRVVHLVAQKLGLSSGTKDSISEEGGKCVIVTRAQETNSRPTLTSSISASSTYLSPYASSYMNGTSPGSDHSTYTPTSSYPSPYHTPSTTSSPAQALRIKKSMPDLRGFQAALSMRESSSSRLAAQRSSGNLRESREYASMGAAAGSRKSGVSGGAFGFLNGGDIPPVPALPIQHRPSLSIPGNTISTDETTAPPTRHPRGPAGESRGFSTGTGSLGESLNIRNQGLRTSASVAVMRQNSAWGGRGLGRGVKEEEEGEAGEGVRTRESLDL